MRMLLAAVAAGLCLVARAEAPAPNAYPVRTITIVVPSPPGGGLDVFARIIAEALRTSFGRTVIVENVGGAGGSIGAGKVARAPADGYMLLLGSANTHVNNALLYPLDYDVVRDFEPVSLLTIAGRVIVSRADVPARDLSGLVDWIRARPGTTAGTPGVGSIDHIAGVLFESATRTSLRHVPYRGSAPALQDLLAGNLDIMFTGITEALPHLRAGRLKAYAITAPSRLPSMPDLPTAGEAGLKDFHPHIWTGLWAPRGTPAATVERLAGAVRDALSDPAVRARFPEPALIVPPEQRSPRALRERQREDIEKWWPVIRAADIRAE